MGTPCFTVSMGTLVGRRGYLILKLGQMKIKLLLKNYVRNFGGIGMNRSIAVMSC